ncbi:MAG TPA: DNA primase [Pirellulales bacterium]|jgi:DNA primase|nr:DNA primase [Pirellulales bacterium]
MSFDAMDAKERVRQAVDIVDLVGSYLSLRREGRGYKAICPWHDDSRPSLQVNPERQSFKCWVCDIGGDVFSFIMQIEGVTFPEALTLLAERAGITLERQARGAAGAIDKRALYQAMEWAVQHYHRLLIDDPQAAPARHYLAERGIAQASIERFRLGFAPNQWSWLADAARGTSHATPVLEKTGLLRVKTGGGHYDWFRGRLMFPCFDAQGRAVGAGGRVLPGLTESGPADKAATGAKYVNSPETPLYSKSNLLYGLHLAREAIRKTHTALVMEGYTDVIVAHQCGFENAVAVSGTALGSQQIRLLQRFADRLRIVLVLDGDAAGRRRANEVLELFVAENADVRVLTLPDQLDPCEFLLSRGPEAFAALIDQAPDALTHAERDLTAGIDLTRDVHQASEALEQLLRIVARGPRLSAGTTTDDRLREAKILQRLAFDFHMPEEQLRSRLSQLRRPSTGSQRGSAAGGGANGGGDRESGRPGEPRPAKIPLTSWERELLELVVAAPIILGRAAESVKPSQFNAPFAREIYSRALDLAAAGVTPDFPRLLLEFDDPQVKNLLVELDEQARQKPAVEIDARLQDVLASFQHRVGTAQMQTDTARLKQQQLSDDEALALLLKIQQQAKNRQGISPLTDG